MVVAMIEITFKFFSNFLLVPIPKMDGTFKQPKSPRCILPNINRKKPSYPDAFGNDETSKVPVGDGRVFDRQEMRRVPLFGPPQHVSCHVWAQNHPICHKKMTTLSG